MTHIPLIVPLHGLGTPRPMGIRCYTLMRSTANDRAQANRLSVVDNRVHGS